MTGKGSLFKFRSLAFASVLGVMAPVSESYAENFVPTQTIIPKTLFGLHIHRFASTTAWPSVPFGAWSLVDARVNWHHLQPQPNLWKFDLLDKYTQMASAESVELLLPMGFPPSWASARPLESGPYGLGTAAEPRNLADWRRYVETVARRYTGSIRQYQVWDEPNEKRFFTGTPDRLLALYREMNRIVKSVDRNIKIVSPGLVGSSFAWLDGFLKNGGANLVDVIGFHFYTPVGQADKTLQRPESMLPLAKKVREVMANNGVSHLPLWNTGIGYWNQNSDGTPENMDGIDHRWIKLDPQQAVAWLARTFILGWALGMERVYWYSWDHRNLGLTEPTSKMLKPAGVAYREIAKWLVGSTMSYCNNDKRPLWVCELRRSGDRKAWIIWREFGQSSEALPRSWNAIEYQTLNGTTKELMSVSSEIMVTEQPILIKSDGVAW